MIETPKGKKIYTEFELGYKKAIEDVMNLCRSMGNNTYFTDDWLRDFAWKLEQLKSQDSME